VRRLKSTELIPFVLLVPLFIGACAPQYKARIDATAFEGILWPGKPEKPRIKYLWSLQNVGAEEKEDKKTYLDMIAGRADHDITNPKTSDTLLRPQGVYVDERRYYIADPGAGRVTLIDRKTMDVVQITEARGEPLEYPLGVVAGADGRIFVSDADMGKVAAYSDAGKFLYFFEGEIGRPTGLAIDHAAGIVYVVDTLGHNVIRYGLDGKKIGSFGRRGEEDGEFNYPGYVNVDGKGQVYVSDSLNFRVQIFSSDGKFIGKFGVLGDSFDTLDKPKGVAVDREGHIYVVDAGPDMVKIFDVEGRLLLFFGERGQRYGDFYLPTGIFIDKNNIIYVADTVNMRVQAFQFLGGE